MMKKIPNFVKFSYQKKERLWVRVVKIEKDIVIGRVAANPITEGLKFNDLVKIKLSNVIDYIY